MVYNVCVLGAGVVGLSCALKIKQDFGADFDVMLIADKFGEETTSNVAAGIFYAEAPPLISGYTGKRASVGK